MTLDRKLTKLDSEKLHPILQSTLEQQWDISLPVTGNSMQPLWMHNRDSVVLTSCDPYTLKKVMSSYTEERQVRSFFIESSR